MPHALTELNLAEVTKPAAEPAHEIRAGAACTTLTWTGSATG